MYTITATDKLLNAHTVRTHNGVFHADEVVSMALIAAGRQELPASVFLPAFIERSRKPFTAEEESSSCYVMVDVGEGDFDHHGAAAGRTFEFEGAVYPHCAATLVAQALCQEFWAWPRFESLLKAGLLAVACQDNGVEIPAGAPNLFGWVNSFNPAWNEPHSSDKEDEAFKRAFELAKPIVDALIARAEAIESAESELRTLKRVAETTEDAVVEIPAGLPGWQKVLAPTNVKFVVFEGTADTPFYLQCVPPTAGSFEQKVPHPEGWRGLRGDALSAASGITGGVFCHAGGFISGWQSRGEAIAAAEKILRG